jgi:hypothetical protein
LIRRVEISSLFFNKEREMLILGLDVSTSTIGYTILKYENDILSLIECNFFKPSKKLFLFPKLQEIKNKINSILIQYNPDFIAIEDIVKFMPQKSRASTILSLAYTNRIVGLTAYEFSKKEPLLANVMSIRHKLKLSKKLPKKEDMRELAEKHLSAKLPILYDKKGKIKSETYDMSDSCCVALFCFYKLIEKKK